jgi:DNA-binding NtrC family response regulator
MARILIVDDQDSIREALAEALTFSGHSVIKAANGTEALALFPESQVELVISDLRMPGMNGIELLKILKNIHPDTLFVLMTAYGSVDNAVTAIKQGAEDYIMKPFDMIEMERRISRILSEKIPKAANSSANGFEGYISSNSKMLKAYELTRKASQSKATVLIRG